ncbi:hypothetical protein TrCOL_g11644 [Triparma columacea]|nr:hypothetical protein TrCOL_g11644 [Triparma columacea]
MHPGHSATVFYSPPSASFSVSLCRGVWGVIPGRGGSKNNPLPEGSAKHFSARCFNAVSENLASLSQRLLSCGNTCLLPLDGFYEWTQEEIKGSKKQPYFIYRPEPPASATGAAKTEEVDPSDSPPPLMVACLYSDVSTGGENPTTMRTFSVMTTCTTKSSGIDWLHSRMPLICTTKEACFEWLKVSTLDAGMEVIKSLRNSQPPAFVTHPVTKKINKTGAKVECPWKRIKPDKPKSVASFFSSPTKSPSSPTPSPFATKSTSSAAKRKLEGGDNIKVAMGESKKEKRSIFESTVTTSSTAAAITTASSSKTFSTTSITTKNKKSPKKKKEPKGEKQNISNWFKPSKPAT